MEMLLRPIIISHCLTICNNLLETWSQYFLLQLNPPLHSPSQLYFSRRSLFLGLFFLAVKALHKIFHIPMTLKQCTKEKPNIIAAAKLGRVKTILLQKKKRYKKCHKYFKNPDLSDV